MLKLITRKFVRYLKYGVCFVALLTLGRSISIEFFHIGDKKFRLKQKVLYVTIVFALKVNIDFVASFHSIRVYMMFCPLQGEKRTTATQWKTVASQSQS